MPRCDGFIQEWNPALSLAGVIFVCNGIEGSGAERERTFNIAGVDSESFQDWLALHAVPPVPGRHCASPDLVRVQFDLDLDTGLAVRIERYGTAPGLASPGHHNLVQDLLQEMPQASSPPKQTAKTKKPLASKTVTIETESISLSDENSTIAVEVSRTEITVTSDQPPSPRPQKKRVRGKNKR